MLVEDFVEAAFGDWDAHSQGIPPVVGLADTLFAIEQLVISASRDVDALAVAVPEVSFQAHAGCPVELFVLLAGGDQHALGARNVETGQTHAALRIVVVGVLSADLLAHPAHRNEPILALAGPVDEDLVGLAGSLALVIDQALSSLADEAVFLVDGPTQSFAEVNIDTVLAAASPRADEAPGVEGDAQIVNSELGKLVQPDETVSGMPRVLEIAQRCIGGDLEGNVLAVDDVADLDHFDGGTAENLNLNSPSRRINCGPLEVKSQTDGF